MRQDPKVERSAKQASIPSSRSSRPSRLTWTYCARRLLGRLHWRLHGENSRRHADLPARARDAAAAGARAAPARAPAGEVRRRARGAAGAALPRQVGAEGRVSLRAPAGAARGVRPDPRLLWHAREGDDRRVHASRPRGLGGLLRPRARRGRSGAGHRRPRRLRLRPLHRRPRPPLRRRAARLHRRPRVGRQHAAPGAAARGPRRRDPLLHAELRARDRRPRLRARAPQPARRRLRRRALDGGAARGDRGRARADRARHLRPVGGDGAGRVRGMRRGTGRRARERGPLPRRGRRPAVGASRCRTARSASSSSRR